MSSGDPAEEPVDVPGATGDAPGLPDDRELLGDEPPGRHAMIVGAHVVSMAVSGVVALIALASVVFADGPRGSEVLGWALFAVAAITVWAGWESLRQFRRTDKPRLLWMAVVGVAWMGVALSAPGV